MGAYRTTWHQLCKVLAASGVMQFIRIRSDTGQIFSITPEENWRDIQLSRSCLSFSSWKKR